MELAFYRKAREFRHTKETDNPPKQQGETGWLGMKRVGLGSASFL